MGKFEIVVDLGSLCYDIEAPTEELAKKVALIKAHQSISTGSIEYWVGEVTKYPDNTSSDLFIRVDHKTDLTTI